MLTRVLIYVGGAMLIAIPVWSATFDCRGMHTDTGCVWLVLPGIIRNSITNTIALTAVVQKLCESRCVTESGCEGPAHAGQGLFPLQKNWFPTTKQLVFYLTDTCI